MNNDASPSSFELPTPQPIGPEEHAPSQEQLPASPEMSTPSPTPKTAVPVPPTPQTNPQVAPVPVPIATAAQAAASLQADDGDLIEKEWVQKAKQIIASTKNDPHVQNKEMSRMKADYLKKRYNKDIKTEEA